MYWVDVEDADKYLTVHGTAPGPHITKNYPVQNVSRGWEVLLNSIRNDASLGMVFNWTKQRSSSFIPCISEERLIQDYGWESTSCQTLAKWDNFRCDMCGRPLMC